ncbi:MAG: U32 family peptidase [Rhodospirillaceae bacterium]|nr:U32 family peptidase [Rhodospirillaceae bacterium]MBT4940254.1 U32 family peptidase [Rhodospirillaceae bacterium]MBT7267894.1 U32 family peptidase [Rhodospirillaceae bacterium]
MQPKSQLTLGPVLFNWPVERWRDFYFRIADEAPLDTVYLGEVVCSKRLPFYAEHLPVVAERLMAAGKDVVFSTLALVMNKRELDQQRNLAQMTDTLIEANDLSAISALNGRPHIVGPYINTYNEGTAAHFVRRGAQRIVLPPELPGETIGILAETGIDLEVQVFGRLPLALSSRCYHARSRNLHKDNCQFVCAEDLDGMTLSTVDGSDFLTVNGTQTLSYRYGNLAGELSDLQNMGVTHFRLSPHATDMVAVTHCFRRQLDGELTVDEALNQLSELLSNVPFADGFFHDQAGVAWNHARNN